MKRKVNFFFLPYLLWIGLFVLAPVALILYKSFFDIEGHVTLSNYQTFLPTGLI